MGIRLLGMKYCYSLFVGILFPTICFAQSSLEGSWKGNLSVMPGNSIALGLNIGSEQNKFVTMDSPDQGAFGLPCSILFQSADSISIAVQSIGMTYSAKLVSDKLIGKLTQQGYTFPLDFSRGRIIVNRPQNPKPPFKYKVENVTFSNPKANNTLGGTLTLPDNFSKSTPIVIMVSGSGLQNRDEEIFYHKPFAVLADYLANNGIASLRYDDRGIGESSGNGAIATTADFASDASSALNFVRNQYSKNKIGILGHSEGGQIAFILASAPESNPDFIVTLGAPAVRGDSLLAEQSVVYLKSVGIDSIAASDYQTAVLKLYELIKLKGAEEAKKNISSICPGWDFLPQYKAMKANLVAITENVSPWLCYSISYSPRKDIEGIKCPALVLYGSKDTQVPSHLNAPLVEKYSPKSNVIVFDGLNHLMQHCVTGSVMEYGKIEETMSSDVMKTIAEFINSVR